MAQTVLITGSSSGIGRATAEAFAKKGWNVSATARNPVDESIWGRPGNTISPRLDVTDEASIALAIAATLERFGSIDAVVNNAGYGLFGPVEGTTAEQLEAVFRTNVFGMANVIRQVLPHMRRRRSGVIVNVSSVAGRVATPYLAPYNATKFAVEGLSEALRFELEAHNIRVKLIEPGIFKTNFATQGLEWSKHAAYEPQLSNLIGWVSKAMERAKDPAIVAEAIFDAANDTSHRLRYPVGGGLLAIRAILPDALWRWILELGMNRAPRSPQGNARQQEVTKPSKELAGPR
jgi:NAD(P)-dependent dehydrogenase (short-subunit alcohol dehydrogenase family)